jgi:ABC-type branched-subunit amino acid transport system ATPase component
VGLGGRKNAPIDSQSYLRLVSRPEADAQPAWWRPFGGQQQLAIDGALVLEPKLLILDESTEGIQPNIVHEIDDIVLELNEAEGLTVLLVEQKLPLTRRVASEFCILDQGRRVGAGSIGELTDDVVRADRSVLTTLLRALDGHQLA